MLIKSDNERTSQRKSAIVAIASVVAILLILPMGAGLADWQNEGGAPDAEGTRYAEITGQTGVTFDMDSTAFKNSGSFRSYYVWENASGDVHYSNVTHTAGVLSVTVNATSGLNSSAYLSWAVAKPYYSLYLDYTALDAYNDNVVRIRLYISSLYVAANPYARTITLSAGGQTFYTTTLAKTDTDSYIDENITVGVNDLRRAIIEDGGGKTAFFNLKVTAQDTTLSIANSAMFAYSVTKLVQRDDYLMIFAAITMGALFVGSALVLPGVSLPIGPRNQGIKKGRW